MGAFISAEWQLHMADHVLTHLQYVVVQKFRRDESFLLTWVEGTGAAVVERSLWLSPRAAFSFEFDSSDAVPLSLPWVAALTAATDTLEGLRLVDAHGADLPVLTDRRA